MAKGFKDTTAIGKRLRRLSSLIDQDVKRFYDAEGVSFEQRWFGVLNELALKGPMSVKDLAEALRITHASVSETRKSLEERKLIGSRPDKEDGRQRLLSLTKSGEAFIETMQPLWQALEDVSVELNTETRNVVAALDRLSAALDKKSLFERAREKLD